MKFKTIKRVASLLCTVVVAFTSSLTPAHAATFFYEKATKETIGKGITYESNRIVTNKGLLDVYVLKAPLKDPYIKIKPAQSAVDYGLKEKTSKLLTDNGAIAGTNGDFFDIAGDYSNTVGAVVKDGTLVSTDIFMNTGKNNYATFFIDNSGNPFIDYLKTNIRFENNGAENIKVVGYNKVPNYDGAIYIDRNAMFSTKLLQKWDRLASFYRIVVENDAVSYISQKGENVEVPENGYVILTDNNISSVKVGDKCKIKVSASIDYEAMQSAIGGAGKLLSNGQIVIDSGYVAQGTAPRTAIGFNKENNEIIMLVADGRTHSIGATHDELASLMLKYGAYNAMHLDGGGSSAMGVKKLGEKTVSVVNTPSGGTERKVANALGIFIEAPQSSEIKALTVKPQNVNVFKGTGVPVKVFGSGEYYNEIELEKSKLVVSFTDSEGEFKDGLFYPSKLGEITFSANYEQLSGSAKLNSLNMAALMPNVSKINAGVSGKTQLSFNGISKDGISAYVYGGVKYEVFPSERGHMEGDTFVADSTGAGYIKCSVGDVVCYIDVNVGYKMVPIYSFSGVLPLYFSKYPDMVGGDVWIGKQEERECTTLEYKFDVSEITQAAYVGFEQPLLLKDNPKSITLHVYGDNSNNWLRAKILDSSGNDFVIDLAKEISWEGWKQVTANLPYNVKYPVYLEKVYVAAVSSASTYTSRLHFADLSGDVLIEHKPLEHSASTLYRDNLKADLANESMPNSFDITVCGDIAINGSEKPEKYSEIQNKAITKLKEGSTFAIFAGTSDIDYDIGVKASKWGGGYHVQGKDNTLIIYMSAAKGGLMSTDVTQWSRFEKDIANSGASHVIIVMDKSPLNFSVTKEYMLLHDVLKELGKNVFVVSTEGTTPSINVKDKIRYINLGGLFKGDKTENYEGFGILRFRISGNDIKYEIK